MAGTGAFAIDSRGCRRLDAGRAIVQFPGGWTAPGVFGGMAVACAIRASELFAEPGSEPALEPLSASAMFHRPLAAGAAELEMGPPTAASAMSRQVDWRALTPWMARGEGGPVIGWLRPRRTPWIAGGFLDPLWYMVAADLLGPGFFMGTPFRVATVSLNVQVLGLTRSPWLLVRATPDAEGPWAGGRVELWDRAGRLVATAAQRARLLVAGGDELPWCVTAFGSGACREIADEPGDR